MFANVRVVSLHWNKSAWEDEVYGMINSISFIYLLHWFCIDEAVYLHYFLSIAFPQYNLPGGFLYIQRKYMNRTYDLQEHSVDIQFADYFSAEIVLPFIMPMVHCALAFCYIKAKGYCTCLSSEQKISQMIPCQNQDHIHDEDGDVSRGREKVANIKSSNMPVVAYIQNLRKEFVMSKSSITCFVRKLFLKENNPPREDYTKVAVQNTTFAVDTGEILGLLGPNGSGKTTTIKMMTAETKPTKGQVIIEGCDIQSCKSESFKKIGYYPQKDTLLDSITLKEHIEFYAKLRGVPKRKIQAVVDYFIDIMKLDEHKNKTVEKLSGGTRRMVVELHLSIFGGQEFVLLDEPSTGIDPQSKRLLWNTIKRCITGERGAILATHDVEEAEVLCSKVAIMVDGKLQCLGCPQYLKDKYGNSYLLEAKLKRTSGSEASPSRMEALKEHISLFPEAICLEKSEEKVLYKVPKEGFTSLGHVFSELQKAKRTHFVEWYSFSQTNLEQVFLKFTRQQMDIEEQKFNCSSDQDSNTSDSD